IGDGVKTDVAGAIAAGVDVVYVASAVSLGMGVELTTERLAELFPATDAAGRPVAAMTELAW
ncbi:MAG: TIGR01459 family HAD-type hydrolase, partial [Pseudomonadota bacterium]